MVTTVCRVDSNLYKFIFFYWIVVIVNYNFDIRSGKIYMSQNNIARFNLSWSLGSKICSSKLSDLYCSLNSGNFSFFLQIQLRLDLAEIGKFLVKGYDTK